MDPDSLLKSLHKEVPAGVACLIHFRIGTHGGDGPEFTHPFPLSTVPKDMYMLAGRIAGQVLVHNGVISGFGKAEVFSDTQDFTIQLALGKVGLERAGRYNRIAILSPDGSVIQHGDWVESEGILYSSDSYVPYEPRWAVLANKSKGSFVGLKEITDESTPVELPDTDTVSVGQLLKKKYPGAAKVLRDRGENVYIEIPGFPRPVCIGALAFGYGGYREPIDSSKRSLRTVDDLPEWPSATHVSSAPLVGNFTAPTSSRNSSDLAACGRLSGSCATNVAPLGGSGEEESLLAEEGSSALHQLFPRSNSSGVHIPAQGPGRSNPAAW